MPLSVGQNLGNATRGSGVVLPSGGSTHEFVMAVSAVNGHLGNCRQT